MAFVGIGSESAVSKMVALRCYMTAKWVLEMGGRRDSGLRTAVMVLGPRLEVARGLVCLTSRRAPLISKAAIAVVVERIQQGRRMSSGTQLHLRLGAILNQRRSMGSVAQTEVESMVRVEGGFPRNMVRRPLQGS